MPNEEDTLLVQLTPGARAAVSKLQGGRGFASRLAGMGISVGCQIEMLQNPARGPLLVRVRDTRIALGRGEASNIVVRASTGGLPDAAE